MSMSREETIERLMEIRRCIRAEIRRCIRADLADETADRQVTLEFAVTTLTNLIGDLNAPAAQAEIELILDLAIPFPIAGAADTQTCRLCGGCPAGDECIGAYLVEGHKPCSCSLENLRERLAKNAAYGKN